MRCLAPLSSSGPDCEASRAAVRARTSTSIRPAPRSSGVRQQLEYRLNLDWTYPFRHGPEPRRLGCAANRQRRTRCGGELDQRFVTLVVARRKEWEFLLRVESRHRRGRPLDVASAVEGAVPSRGRRCGVIEGRRKRSVSNSAGAEAAGLNEKSYPQFLHRSPVSNPR